MNTNDQNNSSGQEANAKLPADNDSNLTQAERQAITERVLNAIEEARLNAEVGLPEEPAKIALSNPDPMEGYKSVRLLNIYLEFLLHADAPESITSQSPPWIFLWVEHTGGHILKDAAFEEGVSKALSASIKKRVKVECNGGELGSEGLALMHNADDASAWNLADYILAEEGYPPKPDTAAQ